MDLYSTENRRLSTKDFVYFEIKKQIIENTLQPSLPINEITLASQLGISRTPVREALQRLEIEELIIRQPNGRLKVAPISIQEAREIFSVRQLLEGLVVKEATLKATNDDINKLQMLTDLLNKAAESDRRMDVVNYGSEIHSYLYKISGNITAVKILNNMNDHILRYRRLGPTESITRSKEASVEHQQLFETIAKRDYEKAEFLMKEHIRNSLAAAIISIETHLKKMDLAEGICIEEIGR